MPPTPARCGAARNGASLELRNPERERVRRRSLRASTGQRERCRSPLLTSAEPGLVTRRAPAQQHLDGSGIDYPAFGDTTLRGAVAADVLPLELTRCVCIGID